jgi:hypothetical protein
MTKFAINMTGNRELGAKINKIIKKLDTAPEKTLNRMVYETQLYGMMVAPRRSGKTALAIKTSGRKNYRVIYTAPVFNKGYAYNIAIDRGLILKGNPSWGQNTNDPRMTDKRSVDDKLYYFVGNDSNEGKTLMFVKKNFKRHVDELGKMIAIS